MAGRRSWILLLCGRIFDLPRNDTYAYIVGGQKTNKDVFNFCASYPPCACCTQTAGPALGYSLKSDGTYAYSRGYLEELARKNGYETVILKRHSTMVQRGEAAPGYMGVLRKPM